MRKLLQNFSTLTLFFAFTAMAHAESFPSKLQCTTESSNPMIQSFELFDLDTTDPKTTLDASFEMFQGTTLEIESGTTYVDANNGCDNSYEFAFFSDELREFKNGNLKQITGMLRFYNSETPESVDPDNEFGFETILFKCK